ncbi:MAG: VanZ family protein [Bryobacteraceae bacterium]|jgi:VanZ family protein
MSGEERRHNTSPNGRSFAPALAVTVALILYGSLYPFEFHNHVDPAQGVRHLLSTWHTRSSIGDLLANILLYLPLGFFAARTAVRLAPLLRVCIAVLGGALLSMSVEYAQLWDLQRVSAMSDVYANSIGAFLGALAGTALAIDLHLSHWKELRRRPYAFLMILCWIAYRLFPYVPVIDAQKYWHAVRPLLQTPSVTVIDLVPYFASWLAVGALLQSTLGPVAGRYALPALLMATLCARIAISDIALSQADVIGGFAAAATWVAWLQARKYRLWIVAFALAATVVVDGLRPFRFLSAPRTFDWIPFLGLIDGSIWTSLPAHIFKFFLYGTLVWSVRRSGLGWLTATITTAVLVFLVHYLQIYLPGRSAEITDLVLVLMASALMRTLEREVESRRPSPGESAF